MLAGRRPFRGEDSASLISAILRDEPESLASAAPSTPVGVRLVVERCLAKEPRESYASTRDLARDLASWKELASGGPVAMAPPPTSVPSLSIAGRSLAARRRLVAAVATGALALTASAGVWIWRVRGDREKAPVTAPPGAAAPVALALDPKRVVVAAFENRTGDPSLDPVGRMAAEWITQGISGLRIDVVPSVDVFDVPRAESTDGGPGHSGTIRALAGRTEAALAGVREFARLAPADVFAQLDVAAFALFANRPREAEEKCRAPVALDLLLIPARPWGASWFRVHGDSLHALGRHEEELATVRRGRDIYPTRPELLRAEVRALVPLGRNDEVDRLVENGLDRAPDGEPPESLLLEAAAELRGHAHPEDARRMADRAASRLLERPEEGRSREERVALARALLSAERWQEALPFLAKLEKERPGEAVTWTGLRAIAAQRSGDRDAASRLDEALRRLDRPYLFGKHLFARAGLAAHRGEKEKAVELLRKALAHGYFSEDAGASFFAHRTLELTPLLGYPPFEELITPKG